MVPRTNTMAAAAGMPAVGGAGDGRGAGAGGYGQRQGGGGFGGMAPASSPPSEESIETLMVRNNRGIEPRTVGERLR